MSSIFPSIIWLYGLPGAGKTTLANTLAIKMQEMSIHIKKLDGDDLRLGLNSNLGFSNTDRLENIRRSAEVAKLFVESETTCICSFITPTNKTRDLVQQIVGKYRLIDVFVKASLETCRSRDPKGFYRKAEEGLIKNFTGIDSLFEVPENPHWMVDTEKWSVEECVNYIIEQL